MGARERVLGMMNAAWTTQAIGTACELGLPDFMAGGAATSAEVAARAGANADAVHRLLRALVSLGLCSEQDGGRFVLTSDGAVLASHAPDSLGAWARLSKRRIWENWSELAASVRTGESARLRLRGSDDFSDLARHAGDAAAFHAAMVDLTRPVARAAARDLDWSGVNTVLDVGGGAGIFAVAVLERHPGMHGVVFDLAHALAPARELIDAAGMGGRCEFVAGDFFAAIPLGADAYVLKSVLHDWDDARALVILTRCAEAMGPGARALIVERILPERLSPCDADRDVARSDLNMLVGCGGRERTEAQFRELVEAAGLRVRHSQPLVAGLGILVATR